MIQFCHRLFNLRVSSFLSDASHTTVSARCCTPLRAMFLSFHLLFRQTLVFRHRLKISTVLPLLHQTLKNGNVLQRRENPPLFIVERCWPLSAPLRLHPTRLHHQPTHPLFSSPSGKPFEKRQFLLLLLGAMCHPSFGKHAKNFSSLSKHSSGHVTHSFGRLTGQNCAQL